jgi:predicted Zn-dependent protease with MMP-like domain
MARMSMQEFRELVRHVMETLPPEFKPHIKNLVVDAVDEPSYQLLRKARFTDKQIARGQSLLGLFEPMYVPGGIQDIDTGDRPNRLWVFKKTHEEQFPDPKQLRIEIRKTVIHELAHHFGFTEEDLARFDAKPDPFSKENDSNRE